VAEYKGLLVAFEKDMPEEFVDALVRAITLWQGVAGVKPVEKDMRDDMMVTLRTNKVWRDRLERLLREAAQDEQWQTVRAASDKLANP
jgi:hypothetical protein